MARGGQAQQALLPPLARRRGPHRPTGRRMARHQRIPGHTHMKAPVMDLLDRYLAAVGALLPGRQRADITDELRDVLMNRAEEKEAELGRPLKRKEEADLLRAFG